MLTYREYDSNPKTEDPKRHLYRLKQESQKEREYLGYENQKKKVSAEQGFETNGQQTYRQLYHSIV